jgi:hypothetical protein
MDPLELDAVIGALQSLTMYVEQTSGRRSEALVGAALLPGRARGPLQQAVADLPGLMDPVGLTSVEIAARLDYSVPNTYRLVRALCESGVIEAVPGSGPHRWRLSSAHRRSPEVFERYARTVGPGEWTSCSDLSIAGRGDVFGARLVCWAAGRGKGFPHPHRVLLEGGLPHPVGHDHERPGPAEVRGLLAREGLTFTPAGRAAPGRRVTWDQLRDRAVAHQESGSTGRDTTRGADGRARPPPRPRVGAAAGPAVRRPSPDPPTRRGRPARPLAPGPR